MISKISKLLWIYIKIYRLSNPENDEFIFKNFNEEINMPFEGLPDYIDILW